MEIKFRAWDKETQRMIYDTTPYARMGKNLVMCVGSRGYNKDQCQIETNIDCVVPIECIMQYSGLKDKNGVEIYEGDILLSSYLRHKYVVQFKDGKFIAATKSGRGILQDFKHAEKIGNVWEKHDLLDEPPC